MDFLGQLVLMTIAFGLVGYFLIGAGDKHPLLGIAGAFSLIGAAGGLLFVGLMIAALVYSYISQATFGFLGIVIASPFILGPVYLIWKLLSGSGREYNGRGFEDGDGSN